MAAAPPQATSPAPDGPGDGWGPGAVQDRYAVQVTLRGGLADVDEEVLATFADRVQASEVARAPGAGGVVELTFTHASSDLWLTLLATMNAARATGCEAVAVTARVAGAWVPVL